MPARSQHAFHAPRRGTVVRTALVKLQRLRRALESCARREGFSETQRWASPLRQRTRAAIALRGAARRLRDQCGAWEIRHRH